MESIDLIWLSHAAHISLMLHDGATFEKLTDAVLTDEHMGVKYYVMRHVGGEGAGFFCSSLCFMYKIRVRVLVTFMLAYVSHANALANATELWSVT